MNLKGLCMLMVALAGWSSICSGQDQDLNELYLRSFYSHSVWIDRLTLNSEARDQICGDLSLLAFPGVLRHLALSDSQATKVEGLFPKYQLALFGLARAQRRLARAGEQTDTPLEIIEHEKAREELRDALSRDQLRRLEKVDRFISIRRAGVASSLKAFSEKGVVPGEEQIRVTEKEVWEKYAREGGEAWQTTIREVAKLLPDGDRGPFDEHQPSYESNPLWADVTLFFLHSGEDVWKVEDFESERDEILHYTSRMTAMSYPLHGNPSRREIVISSAVNDTLRFFISDSYWETYKSGSSTLGLSEDQLAVYERVSTALHREQGEIEKRRLLLGDSKADEILKESLVKSNDVLVQNWRNQVWDEVLFPFQRAHILETARRQRELEFGPYAGLMRSDLPDTNKAQIKDEFAGFEKRLGEIETVCHKELLKLYNAQPGAWRIDLADKPKYLLPSLFFMTENAKPQLFAAEGR